MLALKHKSFQPDPLPLFYWGTKTTIRVCEAVRRQAEDFAAEVGAENIVSIVEHAFGHLTVVVWYREEPAARPKPVRADEFFEAPSFR